MATRRTTLAADADDLAVLEGEARRRGVSLAALLRDMVTQQASSIRDNARPRFGIVRGDGTATAQIAEDEHAPARRATRS
jgi:Ribbon-helix-helix protein, copG family